MPRSFSSLRRSVSWPVSARTSEVLPWSMCPAVPMMRGMSEVDVELGGSEDAAQVEQEAALVDAAEDGRARAAEAGRDALGAHPGVLDRERTAGKRGGGDGAAPPLALPPPDGGAITPAPPARHPR